MPERVCYRLAPRSPFHIGDKGVGLEETTQTLHSDTLFSAICIALAQLGEDLDHFLADFPTWTSDQQDLEKTAPFRISSAFPYFGDVCFFPRPLIRLAGFDAHWVPTLGKTVKKISFVSAQLFLKILQGEDVSSHLYRKDESTGFASSLLEENLLQSGAVWLTADERKTLKQAGIKGDHLWHQNIVPRVTVDRRTSASAIFSTGRIWFSEGAGLFFLVDYEDSSYRPKIEKALRFLADSGIGGERNVGNGQFTLESSEWPFDLDALKKGAGFVTLSLYWPPQSEVGADVLKQASYQLLNRRGWIGTPGGMNLRRRGVNMCREGSFFSQQPVGALVDVKPLDPAPAQNVDHDVWRYGQALAVPASVLESAEGEVA